MINFSWKIGGEAGYGIMTTGLAFSKIASRLGYNIFDFVEYPSLIRGGHNAYEVRVSDEEVSCLKSDINLLICLNEETFNLNKEKLKPDSYVIFDSQEFEPEGKFIKINLPFNKIIKELSGQIIMKNIIALASSLAICGADIDPLQSIIKEEFKDKGEEIISSNQKFAQAGFDYIINNYKDKIKPLLIKKETEDKLVITGNDAFSIASVIADCRLYASYPMTPSSSILTSLAAWQEKNKMVVRHAEDEIAAINNALGASFAGVRSAVGTSGGGFALMVESISFAGVAEIPVVIFLAQRPGPATGMPTWTEQGDLLFAVHAGHGEFPKIVLAPGDHEDMLELTAKAFNLADIYQTPVIVMSDMYLSESHKTVSINFLNSLISKYKVNRGKIIDGAAKFPRYADSDDGISEMVVPGQDNYFYQANSYEHLGDGHTTEDPIERQKQVNKRNRKAISYLKNDFELPKIYGDLEKADAVFVSWGSTKDILKGIPNTALIHFNHIYPLDEGKVKPLLEKNKRYILVENNATGQFGKLLRQETGINISEKILRFDGRPIMREEIINIKL